MRKLILLLSLSAAAVIADNFLSESLRNETSIHESVSKEDSRPKTTYVDIDPQSEVGQLVHLLLQERYALAQKRAMEAKAKAKPKPKPKPKPKKKPVAKKTPPCPPVTGLEAPAKEVILESAQQGETKIKAKEVSTPPSVEEKKPEVANDAKKPEPKHEEPAKKPEPAKHGADASDVIDADLGAKKLLAANLCY